MAGKKKSRKKQTKSKGTAGKKAVVQKKVAKKIVTPKKKLTKKFAPKELGAKTKVGGRKATSGGESADKLKKQVRRKGHSVGAVAFAQEEQGAQEGEQSGDLQGLSNVESAGPESVDELLEEGNAFEAEAVSGVEDAEDADEGEVRTLEVPQDDVPGEYRDKGSE